MKQALILHAWQSGPNEHWYPWLRNELEKKQYTVHLPEIPTMPDMLPNLPTQLQFIEKNFQLDHETIVIGHSLGCLLAMRLAEKYTFGKMLLVAGWDFDDLTPEHQSFWSNKLDHETIKKNIKEIYCISSDNDPYMTAYTVEDMSKRLNGKFVLIKNAGHFTQKFGVVSIPELLPHI